MSCSHFRMQVLLYMQLIAERVVSSQEVLQDLSQGLSRFHGIRFSVILFCHYLWLRFSQPKKRIWYPYLLMESGKKKKKSVLPHLNHESDKLAYSPKDLPVAFPMLARFREYVE